MSLTNPNTPVSQQDLQDFYHKLLPYMGGSFGLVATGIDSANLYSTTERVIGQWIDGKPLYQKTIHFGNGTTTNTYKHIAHGITNIDTIVKTEGLDIHNDSEGNGGSMPWVDRTDYIAFMWADKTNINLSTNYDSSAIDYYMTIQYTKTTDSAVESYGTDTTYSTDEHVVGSWIDGSPVYQKTVHLTNVSIPSQGQYADYDLITDTACKLKYATGIFYGNETRLIPFFSLARDRGTLYWSIAVVQTANKICLRVINYNSTLETGEADVTIQYIKTS